MHQTNKSYQNSDPFIYTFLVFSFFISMRQIYRKYNVSIRNKITAFYTIYDTFFTRINKTLYSGLYYGEEDKQKHILQEDPEENKENKDKQTIKPLTKYEDKYLEAIRSKSKEYEFTDEEKAEIDKIFVEQCQKNKDDYEKKSEELNLNLEQIKKDILILKKMTDEEFTVIQQRRNEVDEYNSDESSSSSDIDNYVNVNISDIGNRENCINEKHELWKKIENKMAILEANMNDTEKNKNDALTYANNQVIEKRLDKLKGCFIMEHTPLGNVLLTFNKERTTFSYYSDNSIPYRFLEVAARKFVKTFHCRPIFVDMEEELQNYEKKIEEERKKKEEMLSNNSGKNNENNTNKTKNVFAKLKNYNKPSGKVNTAPPPKSSIPNKNITETNDNFLLKENANRYTYEGKISTFNLLKKVEKKVVDKKYGLTFLDFKRMKLNK
jgi:hypothetical protein